MYKNSAYVVAFTIALLLLAGCGSSTPSVSSAAPPQQTELATPTPIPDSNDDWFTFAHDYARSGYEQQPTGITPANVGSLQLRWQYSTGGALYTSPLVYNGNIIVTSLTGTVYDIASKTGTLLWKNDIGGEIRAAPTIDGNLVFVGNRFADASGNPTTSYLYAIDLTTGGTIWRASVAGPTHAAPVASAGVVYMPTAGGDPPTCLNGGVTAFNEATGTQIWRWEVDSNSGGGGSVWGAPALSGNTLYFGTGNTCSTPWPTANGAVALNTNGTTLAWSYTAMNDAYLDDDTGSGVLIVNNMVVFMNKDGSLYALNGAGSKLWSLPLGAPDQSGGFTTPTSDGTTIFAGAGFISTSGSNAKARAEDRFPFKIAYSTATTYSYLCAVSMNGTLLWKRKMNSTIPGYAAAISGGIAYAALDNVVYALNEQSGSVLWSYQGDYDFYASPVIVPSGLYAADQNGTVYAFALSSAASSQRSRR